MSVATSADVGDDAVVRFDDVVEAARRIRGAVWRTPLERSRWLSRVAGVEVLLKLETHQRTGSFKARGAANAVRSLGSGDGMDVVTASAGNHGLGVAMAAIDAGVPARIHLPASAPRIKRQRIEELGGTVVPVDGGYEAADAAARRDARARGSRYIHAFSDPRVIAGQGTVGLEILEERRDVGVLLVSVGGGGLIGGIGVAARALNPAARVIGVQSEHASAMAASLAAGRPMSGARGPTLCDGLAGDTDQDALALASRVVDEMIVVPERDVGRAIVALHRHEGVLAEGSAAVVVAALLSGRAPIDRGPIAAVLTGSNIDLGVLAKLTEG